MAQQRRAEQGWRFWIDRGGTFTDVLGLAPDGALHPLKLLSATPGGKDAALEGIHRLAGEGAVVDVVRMGTTVATNALLERRGERTLLVITQGFRDALLLAYQNRSELFGLRLTRPEPLYERVVEVNARVSAEGHELVAPDWEALEPQVREALAAGITSAAVVCLHGDRHPEHERLIKARLLAWGFPEVVTSHETSSMIKLVGRGDTTVVNAYLSPVLARYVRGMAEALGPETRLEFMQSSGGLAAYQSFRGRDAVLSGPAGGVVGAQRVAAQAGFEKILSFDMGGTSTDVAHYAGAFERNFETQVAGVRMRTPMLDIHTVAAGGGSLCSFSGGRFRVGPDSAGALPGPACYGHGGPLTITDCNLVTDRLDASVFPSIFGPGQDQPLDRAAAETRLVGLVEEIEVATGQRWTMEAVAQGFLEVAADHMARAIKSITVQRGRDVEGYTLVAFGGAGGQHACMVAQRLGIGRILFHPLAGVLSALGIGLADIRVSEERTLERPLTESALAALRGSEVAAMEAEVRRRLVAQGVRQSEMVVTSSLAVRYEGSDTALTLALEGRDALTEAFAEQHRQRFGFTLRARALVMAALIVEGVGSRAVELSGAAPGGKGAHEGAQVLTGRVRRDMLAVGVRVEGPAFIDEGTATTVVDKGWSGVVAPCGALVVESQTRHPEDTEAQSTVCDPVKLEVFHNLFMSAAEQMGEVLRATSFSVNIKERLDFSCALFDRHGHLVANAPHMPVHLGAMSESVKTLIRHRAGAFAPGDGYLHNAPYNGGTHLPDISLITPVFWEGQLRYFVASRGHQADVGGKTPGSMPPDSVHIDEEGVLLDGFKVIEDGVFLEEALHARLGEGRWPVRNPDHTVVDLKAQAAANARGIAVLTAMIDQFSMPVVEAYMGHIRANAEAQVRKVLASLEDGSFRYEMDSGAVVQVQVTMDRTSGTAHIDFTGSSAQQADNFNAPRAITKAAVLYVFRALIEDSIPLNEGCFAPLRITIPQGSILDPSWPAAVVAGNVETSQVVTDALLGALGVMGAAQGTMNNVTFGNARWQYYETVCGGAGAGDGFDGLSGVHTHMTNTRLTDPEILETRFPVRLDRFELRPNSGGAGRYRGGDGVVRRLIFLEPLDVAIVSNRRRVPPYGMAGGLPGAVGRNWIERADGSVENLGSCAGRKMQAGDSFVLETPGGGGYGLKGDGLKGDGAGKRS